MSNNESKETALLALKIVREKLGTEPVLLHVGEVASYTDYVLIVSGANPRHVRALAQELQAAMKKAGESILSIEGMERCEWVLLDFFNTIIHVFHQPIREYYNLEKLWLDATVVEEGEAGEN